MELSNVGQVNSKRSYSDRDYMIFVNMQKIAETILLFANSDERPGVFYLENQRQRIIGPINPLYLKTDDLLILKVEKGTMAPASICTMLGEWKCFGCCLDNLRKILPEIIDLFQGTLVLYDGSFLYYAVNKVGEQRFDGIKFTKEDTSSRLSKIAWEEMVKRYKKKQNRKKQR